MSRAFLRICTFNVHGWGDASGRIRIDETIAMLAAVDADVVVLNEVFAPGRPLTDVAAALGMRPFFAPAGYGGNALLLRESSAGAARIVDEPRTARIVDEPRTARIDEPRTARIVEEPRTFPLPAAGREIRSAAVVDVATIFGRVVVAGTHLDDRVEDARVRQVDALLVELARHGKRVRDSRLRSSTGAGVVAAGGVAAGGVAAGGVAGVVVAGDFNAIDPADYPDDVLAAVAKMRRENGREPPKDDVVRRMREADFVDATRVGSDPAAGASPPLPARLRSTCWAGTRIDHVWMSAELAARVREATVDVVDTDVSDHKPVVATLWAKDNAPA